MKTAIALVSVLLLSACGNASKAPTLAQAQAEVKVIKTVIAEEVKTYESVSPPSADDAANIDLALSLLNTAVDQFVALGPTASWQNSAQAIIVTARAVVARLPNISVSAKAAIEAGLLVVQGLLALAPDTLST